MTNFLQLSAARDAMDGSLELEIAFFCDGFSGQGTAYFDASYLVSTVEKLSVFPLPADESIAMEGGYFEATQPGVLREKHVSLRFAVGDISPIELRVGTGVPWEHKRGLRQWAEVTFLLDYEQLGALSKAMNALANGEENSARVDLSTFG